MPESITLPCRAELVSTARHAVAALLADTPVADVAKLITSEFMTNSLRWSRSGRPGGSVEIVIDHDPDTKVARLEVHDAGPLPGEVSDEDPDQHGRGLEIAAGLAKVGHTSSRTSQTWWAELSW